MFRSLGARCAHKMPFRTLITVFSLALASFLSPFVAGQSARSAKSSAALNASAWGLSTSRFKNSFEAEPFVGNGHIGLRIPAAGMGFLGGLGLVGWPLGTERVASAMELRRTESDSSERLRARNPAPNRSRVRRRSSEGFRVSNTSLACSMTASSMTATKTSSLEQK